LVVTKSIWNDKLEALKRANELEEELKKIKAKEKLEKGEHNQDQRSDRVEYMQKIVQICKGVIERRKRVDREESSLIYFENIVCDIHTGLTWTKDACLTGETMSWSEANKFIEALNSSKYEGYRSWRLPTRKELEGLLTYSNYRREYNRFQNIRAGYYWTSSFCDANNQWIVDLYDERVVKGSISNNSCYVWPVRNPQFNKYRF
jgi:hypothetical protein